MANRTSVKILSIDGGGIRGIIPALVLAEIERQTGKPASQLFDLIAGTSAGGIIALGVTVPAQDGAPRHSAQELVELFVAEGPKIFSRSLLRKIETLDGLIEEKYSVSGLEAALSKYLDDATLSQALVDVLITSYDVRGHEPFFFKSRQARELPALDYPMPVVARATSAAPTYFEPEHAIPPATAPDEPSDYALVDGGTFANNPAMCAYAEALRDRPGADVLVVSLGTGRLTESISFAEARDWGLVQWARPLLGVIMDGSSRAIDYQLDQLLGARRHFRFQTVLEGVSDSLDDASAANIEGLCGLGAKLIADEAARIAEACGLLMGDTPALADAAPAA
jgi:patatin-like phospholipase/acyl hydrolase